MRNTVTYKLKIEKYKARIIKDYCRENIIALNRFMTIGIINVFLNQRFTAKVYEELVFKIPGELIELLESLDLKVQNSKLILQAIDILIDNPNLFAKFEEKHNFLELPTISKGKLEPMNAYREKTRSAKVRDNMKNRTPKCLK